MSSKKIRFGVAAIGAACACALFASNVMAGNVRETAPECTNANVALLGENPERIHHFIEAKPGLPEVSVVSWEVAFPTNNVTTVYGVKCKSGVACNTFAREFASANPDSSPAAFCGESPMIRGESAR